MYEEFLKQIEDFMFIEDKPEKADVIFVPGNGYPQMAEKAARYAFGIIKNHPFADGNKRTGTALMLTFLRGNGFRFKPRSTELYDTIIAVADGSMEYDELVAWIQAQL